MKKIVLVFLFVILLTGCSSKCNDGYSYRKSDNHCYKTESIDPTTSFQCSEGYVQVNDKCYKEEIKVPISTHSCNKGYTLDNDKKNCYIYKYTNPELSPTCYEGFNFTDSAKTNCIKWIYQNPQPELINNNSESCPLGYKKDYIVSSDKCSKLIGSEPATPLGTCINPPSNTQATSEIYGTCYYYSLTLPIINTTYSMTCNTGYFFNNDLKACVTFERHDAFNKLKCTNGWTLNSNNMCERNDTMDSIVSYSCEKDSELVENKCIRKIESDLTTAYLCPEGYTLKNNKCVKEVIQN